MKRHNKSDLNLTDKTEKHALSKNLRLLEIMFERFNKRYFNEKIEASIVITDQPPSENYTNIRFDLAHRAGDKILYTISLSHEYIYPKSKQLVTRMLCQMIRLEALKKNIKISSGSSERYHNKNFKMMCEKVGIYVKHDKRYGWEPSGEISTENMGLILDLAFDYNPIYCLEQNVHITETNSIPSGRRPTSTRKYIDLYTGKSVRATKNLILFCLTGYNDAERIADQIEKQYGIKRMVKPFDTSKTNIK